MDEQEIIERSAEPMEAVAWGLVAAVAIAGARAAIKGETGVSTAVATAVIAAAVVGARRKAVADLERGSAVMVESVAGANDSYFSADAFASVGKEYGGWKSSGAMRAVVENAKRETVTAQAAVGTGELTVKHWGGERMAVDAWLRSVMDDAAQATAAGEHISGTTLKAVRSVMGQGGVSIGYNGRNYDIAGFVRQRAWDGAHMTMQGLRDATGKEVGWTGVQVSAHAFCAPDHLEYQGRTYTGVEFQYIQDHLERPLGMWNCRHIMTPCPEDARSVYTAAELELMARESTREVTLTGLDGRQRTMSRYEASQWQRGMERGIRGAKVEAQAMGMVGDDAAARAARARARELSAALREGADEAGLRLDRRRTQVGTL